MRSDLEVDADGLRRCAAGLAETAAQVRRGLTRCPPLVVAAPGWAATEGSQALEAIAARQLAAIGDAFARTGEQVVATATEYEAADDRAAGRLRAVR